MERKLNQCGICLQQKVIWKSRTRDHPQMCKDCYNKPKVGTTFQEKEISYDPSGATYHKEFRIVDIKPSKQKPIAKVSAKQLDRLKAYKLIRTAYMAKHLICEAKIPNVCFGNATDIHHKAGKTGELLIDDSYFMALCRYCHSYIETHPTFAKENGFSVDRLDK